MTAPLLLRSPPFPWVTEAVAAVSRPGRSRLADPDRLFAVMRDERVGGDFWCDPNPAKADAREAAIMGWIAGGALTVERRDEAIAAIEAAEYRNPFSGDAIDAHEAVRILADWRAAFDRNRQIGVAVGMSRWKQEAIARFLWDGRRSPPFVTADRAIAVEAAGAAIAYWPSRSPEDFATRAAGKGVAAWLVEDGFIRSAGLGAECRPPLSIIVDPTGGIHFDPEAPSEIERLLASHPFDDALLRRAKRLRELIVSARLGKYGVDRGMVPNGLPADRRIVLAIGQVADDLSIIRGGGPGVAGFVSRVRAQEPDAFIVYRPHPDVVAGLRDGDLDGERAADLVLRNGSLLGLIERADSVHVVSSLTGFEALLRGVPVTVHGMPFYAGWGLTRDLASVPARRGRQLSIDALVAAALILAPRYLDPVTNLPCPPEVLVNRLARVHQPDETLLTGFRRAWGMARRSLRRAGQRP